MKIILKQIELRGRNSRLNFNLLPRLCLILLSILAASCGLTTVKPSPDIRPLSTPTPSTTNAAVSLPAETPTPTATSTPTSMPTPVPTATYIPFTYTPTPDPISIQCIDPVPAQFSELNLDGVLAVYQNPDDTHPDSYLLNLKTGSKFDILDRSSRVLADFIVSPDRKHLAYVDSSPLVGYSPDDRYIIMDAAGKIVVSQYADPNWYQIVDWQDNSHLLIMLEKRNPDGGYIETPATLIRWNPFTGEKERLEPDFPDIYIMPVDWGAYSFSPTIYDPGMRYVIYPFANDGVFGITLWDLTTKRAIVNLNWGRRPIWAPDGQSFMSSPTELEKKDELYLVEISGQKRQVTFFTRIFKEVEIGPYSWSPDGKQVAFWVRLSPDIVPAPDADSGSRSLMRLAVLDLATNQVRLFCISGEGSGTASHGGVYYIKPGQPIWSADGSKLVISGAAMNTGAYLTVVDLIANKAWKLGDNTWALGWMDIMP